MKVRTGFVSNSSSSSFIVSVKPDNDELKLISTLRGDDKKLDVKIVEEIIEKAGYAKGISDVYSDSRARYSADHIADFMINHSSHTTLDMDDLDLEYLPESVLARMKEGYDCFTVELSDESGGIGSIMRNSCDNFCNIKTDKFETVYFS